MVDKLQFPQLVQAFWTINSTVDGINPAPVDMVIIPCPYKVFAPSFRWLFLRISLPNQPYGIFSISIGQMFSTAPAISTGHERSLHRPISLTPRSISHLEGAQHSSVPWKKKKNKFHKRLKSLGLFYYQHKYCALLNVGELPFCIP